MTAAPAAAPAPRLEAPPPGIGVVAPYDLALDRELWRWTPEPVSLYMTRTPALEVAVSVELAHRLGDLDAIASACRAVSVAEPGVTAYLCTSASFVSGLDGEARLRAAMKAAGARHALTTMAIAYNVSTSLFGGTAPATNDWLIHQTGSNLVPAYYMMAACVVGLLALHFVTETVGCSLRGRHIPGVPLPRFTREGGRFARTGPAAAGAGEPALVATRRARDDD